MPKLLPDFNVYTLASTTVCTILYMYKTIYTVYVCTASTQWLPALPTTHSNNTVFYIVQRADSNVSEHQSAIEQW